MKALDVQIDVGQYRFDYVESCEIESSWETLTDTAVFTLPRKLSFQGQNIVQGESLFKRGDQVSIQAGFDGQLNSIYSGFIRDINPAENLTFHCEDAMWVLKQQIVNKSYRSVTLFDLIAEVSPIPFEATDTGLGQLRLTQTTMAKTLLELRKSYGLYSWVREGSLYAGLAYRPELASRHLFRWTHNIISDDLTYSRADDVSIKIRAVSLLPNGKKIETEVGDLDGDLRTLNYYNLSQADLQAAAERSLERIKVEGYQGSFQTFGEPVVQHGDIVVLQDPDYPDREGSYLVKKVVRTLGTGGYFQSIYLDIKA